MPQRHYIPKTLGGAVALPSIIPLEAEGLCYVVRNETVKGCNVNVFSLEYSFMETGFSSENFNCN